MEGWNKAIELIQWLVTTVGGGIAVIGVVLFLMSFGDNGTGDQRRLGIIMFIGGIGIIAAAQLVPVFFTAPPTLA